MHFSRKSSFPNSVSLSLLSVHYGQENSVAICGLDLLGCFTYNHQCDTEPIDYGVYESTGSLKEESVTKKNDQCLTDRVRFGDYESIGSSEQTWVYDKGMLIQKEENGCVGKGKMRCVPNKCVGITRSDPDYDHLVSDKVNDVKMYPCDPENLGQRWMIGDDDRIHAFANDDMCLTVQSDNTGSPFDSTVPVLLTRCTNNSNEDAHKQRFEMIGDKKAMPSFVHPSQTVYGYDDDVRISFWLHDDDVDEETRHKLRIYREGDDNVFYVKMCEPERVDSFSAATLLNKLGDVDKPTSFVARFGSVTSEPFTIHPSEAHIPCDIFNDDEDSENSMLQVGVGVGAAAMVLVIALLYWRKAKKSNASSSAVDALGKPVGQEDFDDDATQGSDDV